MAKKKDQITIREFIFQKDIDELLDSAFVEQAEAAEELELELSDLAEATAFDTDDDERLGSNDDIGALFKNSGAKGPSKGPLPEEDIGSIVNQSYIDALLGGELEVTPSPSRSAQSELESDTGGLISQGDIDALLKGAMTADEVPEPEDAGDTGMVSQSDIDALLGGAGNTSEDTDDVGLISQSDIDALLGGTVKEPFESDDAFEPQGRNENGDVVSQSDIDTLLKGALDSEADTTIGEYGNIDEQIVSQGDIDSLLGESLDAEPSKDEDPLSEPVILAEASEITEASTPETVTPLRPWHTRKRYRISAVAALVFIISSSAFFLMPRTRDAAPKPVVLRFPIPKPEAQVVTAKEQEDTNITLPGFLVLAPSDNNDITCLAADLLLDFSDTTTVRMIKDNEGFIRSVIYGVINDALLSPQKSAVDETKLALAVREALGAAVSREKIRAVSFGKFEII